MVAENVKDLEIDGVKTLTPLVGVPVVSLQNVQGLYLYNCSPVIGTDQFLQLKGKDTKNITVKYNNFNHVQKPIIKDVEVAEAVSMN